MCGCVCVRVRAPRRVSVSRTEPSVTSPPTARCPPHAPSHSTRRPPTESLHGRAGCEDMRGPGVKGGRGDTGAASAGSPTRDARVLGGGGQWGGRFLLEAEELDVAPDRLPRAHARHDEHLPARSVRVCGTSLPIVPGWISWRASLKCPKYPIPGVGEKPVHTPDGNAAKLDL